ncbi:unnamed protein product [Heterobilharzia americana]|nr:unnamed protein product [Heterobilharzia americana]
MHPASNSSIPSLRAVYDTTLDEDDNEDDHDHDKEVEDSAEDEVSDDPNDSSSAAHGRDIEGLEEFNYKESTSDIVSSVSFLSRRITRNYASEFILPDDTRVAVSRLEGIYPMDNSEQVILSLSVGHKNIYTGQYSPEAYQSTSTHPVGADACSNRVSMSSSEKTNTSTEKMVNKSDDNQTADDKYSDGMERKSSKLNSENQSESDSVKMNSSASETSFAYISRGLQIVDYLDDDLWAATILQCDNGSNADLLRQLEAGCRLEPEAYRMERIQTVKNRETVIDFPSKPTVRTINLSRSTSETDSVDTTVTAVDLDTES